MINYLKDLSFLKELDLTKIKELTIRMILLTFDEKPFKRIEGRVKNGGSLSLDGTSAIRRSCSLTMVPFNQESIADDFNDLLAINRKVKIEIGYKNTLKELYPLYKNEDIIWFPLGTFIVQSPSINHSLEEISFSVELKDKMCLLNGECGGKFPTGIDLGKIAIDSVSILGGGQVIKNIVEKENNVTYYQIIQEVVHHWGNEQLGNIHISGVPLQIRKPQRWDGPEESPLYLYEKTDEHDNKYYLLTTDDSFITEDTPKYTKGDLIGFTFVDFVPNSDFSVNAGDVITSVLDRIVQDLGGNFEYFYDVDGKFIFQEKRNYLNTNYSSTIINNNEQNYNIIEKIQEKKYKFDNSNLIESYTNQPQYELIKNDFVVWGSKQSGETSNLIRFHLAIDKKPVIGNSYHIILYNENNENNLTAKVLVEVDNLPSLDKASETLGIFFKHNGVVKTYNSEIEDYIIVSPTLYTEATITTKDWRSELYLSGLEAENLALDSNYYFPELKNEWLKLYNLIEEDFIEGLDLSNIDYYLDFIDTSSALASISVQEIGRRTEVFQNDNINCLFEPQIPEYIIDDIKNKDKVLTEMQKSGYKPTFYDSNIKNLKELIKGEYAFNSAYDTIRNMLYQYTEYNNSISISAFPIYHLEPNTLIEISDKQSNIFGEYMINNISLPLDVEGTMTINATKALNKI